jgi:hypothetical protein
VLAVRRPRAGHRCVGKQHRLKSDEAAGRQHMEKPPR